MDEIILQYLTGRATPAQRDALRAWRARSKENEARIRELSRLWSAAEKGEPAFDALPEPPLAAQVIRRAGRRRGVRRITARLGTRWRYAVTAALTGLVIGVAQHHVRPGEDLSLVLGVDEVVTGPNENATLNLRDGTVVRLAASSRLRVSGTLVDRHVELNGRAYFAVQSQPNSTFRIRTSAGDVRVLGTRFDLDANGEDLRVIVVQGRVAMDVRGREVEVGQGSLGRAMQGTVLPPVEVPEIHRLVDWKSHFLAFQETPLSVAAEEIAATYDVRIEVVDDIAQRTITTWFADRQLSEVLGIVCAIAAAECVMTDDVVRIQPAAP